MGPESAASRGQSWQHHLSSVPATPKPSATLVPAALDDKAQLTRKRSVAETTEDDMAAAVSREESPRRGSAQNAPEGSA